VRFTPSLEFVADALPDNARTIEDLLARARAADEEVRKSATDAKYAGDADPYRKPADEDDDLDLDGAADASGSASDSDSASDSGSDSASDSDSGPGSDAEGPAATAGDEDGRAQA
jgi:ribosome-binding factor A